MIVSMSTGLIRARLKRGPRLLGSYTYPLANGSKAIECWPDVEREHRRTIRHVGSGVVVDDIADLFATARTADDPVVAVEGSFGATQGC
jgi:hypothetical protein